MLQKLDIEDYDIHTLTHENVPLVLEWMVNSNKADPIFKLAVQDTTPEIRNYINTMMENISH